MFHLNVHLLGGFALRYHDLPVDLPQQRFQSLLAYLFLNRHTPQSRQYVAELLWPETNDAQARTNLRNLLYQLRTAWPDLESVLDVDRSALRWRDDVVITLDVETFQQAAQHDQLKTLDQFQRIYSGDLLPSLDDDWLTAPRENLHRLARTTLFQIAVNHAERNETMQAITAANALLQHDLTNEDGYRLLMRIYAATGQAALVEQTYQRCKETLAEESGSEPSPKTTLLIQQLRDGVTTTPKPVAQPTAQLHHFPARSALYVDRPALLHRLIHHLREPNCQLLTLLGPGGVGKTTLAVAAAQQAAKQIDLVDGIYFVDLTSVNAPVQLPLALARALDLSLHENSPPYEQVLLHLSALNTLLVLDNYEQLLPDLTLITEILVQAPAVKLLVTSREALNLRAETRLLVNGLTHPTPSDQSHSPTVYESVILFEQLAARLRPDLALSSEERADIESICELVEGNPLAIEMAAGWLRLYDCAKIRAQLAENFDLLVAQASDANKHHQSMRAVFAQSWQLLTSAEQRVLARLSIFTGSFTIDAAMAVAGAVALDLSSLIDKTLIARDGERLRLHMLLRQFATEKLDEMGHTADVEAQHGRYYLQRLAEQQLPLFGPEPLVALHALDGDLDNIRAAWLWASRTRAIDLLAVAHRPLLRFYELHTISTQAVPLFQEAATHLAAVVNSGTANRSFDEGHLYAQLLLAQAGVWVRLQEHAHCLPLAEQSEEIAVRYGDQMTQAHVQLMLARISRQKIQLDDAEAHLQSALALYQHALRQEPSAGDEFHNRALLADIYGHFGNLKRVQSKFKEAFAYRHRAQNLLDELGDLKAKAELLIEAGIDCWDAWKLDEAQTNFEEALAIYEALGNQQPIMRCHFFLALLHQRHGRAQQARQAFEIALDAATRWGFRHFEAEIRQISSTVYLELGEEGTAREFVSRSLSYFREMDRSERIPDCLISLAEIERHSGNYLASCEHLLEGRILYEQVNLWRGVISCLASLCRIYRLLEQFAEAQDALTEAFELSHTHNELVFLPMLYIQQAFLSLAKEDLKAADEWCTKATDYMQQSPISSVWFRSDTLPQWVDEIRTEIAERQAEARDGQS